MAFEYWTLWISLSAALNFGLTLYGGQRNALVRRVHDEIENLRYYYWVEISPVIEDNITSLIREKKREIEYNLMNGLSTVANEDKYLKKLKDYWQVPMMVAGIVATVMFLVSALFYESPAPAWVFPLASFTAIPWLGYLFMCSISLFRFIVRVNFCKQRILNAIKYVENTGLTGDDI
jgi:hypothetical protein